MGQLPDVLDVVEEATRLNHFNTPTNNPNDEMDEADMKKNTTAEEVEENANMNDMNDHSVDEGMETQTHTKTKGNTHPTHTQVGGWGLWPMIVLGVGILFYCCCCIHVCLSLLLLLHACVFFGCCCCCMHVFLSCGCVLLGLCVWCVSSSFPK